MATAVSEATMKPHQLQVNRLRREEEEESWISGEELYTEGSSEDESSHHHHQHTGHSHHHHNLHHGRHGHDRSLSHQSSPTYSLQDKHSTNPSSKCSPTIEDLDTPNIASASEPAMQEQPHLTETTRRLSLMGIEETCALVGAMGGEQHDSLEEQEEIMLWRPKRGSLKLPHIQLDPPSPPKLDVESKD